MTRKFCYFYLSCELGEESKIANHLLERHLVACAKFIPVASSYWWRSSLEHTNETMIIFESAEDLFDETRAEIKKVHSYDTFVLTQVSMTNINKEATKWLNESLKEAA